jgi:hypothetical protein
MSGGGGGGAGRAHWQGSMDLERQDHGKTDSGGGRGLEDGSTSHRDGDGDGWRDGSWMEHEPWEPTPERRRRGIDVWYLQWRADVQWKWKQRGKQLPPSFQTSGGEGNHVECRNAASLDPSFPHPTSTWAGAMDDGR